MLTVCYGGNCRSVALGYLLKDKYGHDALACGAARNAPETLKMLCDWAEQIIILQPHFEAMLPPEAKAKMLCIDVGEDRWFNSLHPELLGILDQCLEKLMVTA